MARTKIHARTRKKDHSRTVAIGGAFTSGQVETLRIGSGIAGIYFAIFEFTYGGAFTSGQDETHIKGVVLGTVIAVHLGYTIAPVQVSTAIKAVGGAVAYAFAVSQIGTTGKTRAGAVRGGFAVGQVGTGIKAVAVVVVMERFYTDFDIKYPVVATYKVRIFPGNSSLYPAYMRNVC
jgi:hypothetical protein